MIKNHSVNLAFTWGKPSKGWLRDDFLETALTMGKTQKGQWGMTFTSTCIYIYISAFLGFMKTDIWCPGVCCYGRPPFWGNYIDLSTQDWVFPRTVTSLTSSKVECYKWKQAKEPFFLKPLRLGLPIWGSSRGPRSSTLHIDASD